MAALKTLTAAAFVTSICPASAQTEDQAPQQSDTAITSADRN